MSSSEFHHYTRDEFLAEFYPDPADKAAIAAGMEQRRAEQRAFRLARTESEELEENYQILAALEVLAGRLAVAKITADDIADIETLCREVAACPPDDGRLAELNRQFHFRIYQCARSPMLLLLLRLLWRSFPRGPQAGRPHQESVRQHDALVRALKHRNEEQVAAIIRDHVLGSIKYLPQ